MSDTLEGIILGGKYKILRRLGRGGMAEVYLAHQENLGRDVAIKLMHAFLASEQDFLHRFKREARAMAAMNHPNIVGVYDFDVYGESTYYLVMEYISGGTLKDKLAELAEKGERLPLETAVQIGIEVASALEYAHQRSMIHRDVKPANIMLNDTGHAILTDFGIVKLVGGQSMAYTATGALIGTPAYMSPEQALGKSGDARSDIYSLGTLLFQMITGYLPFDADTPLAIVMKHVNEPVPSPATFNPEIPPALQEIVLKAMAKNPEERYQTAGELEMALRHADLSGAGATVAPLAAGSVHHTEVMGTAVAETPLTMPGKLGATLPGATLPDTAVSPTPASASKKRPYWLFGLLGLLVIAAIVAGASGLFSGQQTTETPVQTAVAIANDAPTSPPTSEPQTTTPPAGTPDTNATIAAAISLTTEAGDPPTATPSTTPTPTATASPTTDATRAFLSSCTNDAELVVAYTYNNTRFSTAPVSSTFPANWTLRNSGTCPWPASLQWAYVEGEDFGYDDGPIPLETTVEAGEEITLNAPFVAPNTVNSYESIWQLIDAEGNPFGPEIAFTFSTYVPATATPTTPPASPTPAATATPEEIAELNYGFEIFGCEYINTEWRCTVRLWPIGGAGGPYTLLILDQPGGQATEFRGPWPATYFAMARRCAAYNQEVRVIDDGSGTDFSRHLYIDPDDYFAGGCTLP